jgi:quercetin dioxygenase-like cupin family protein
MRLDRLDDMIKGWFVGDFSPAVLQTTSVEVGVKKYSAGDHEAWHFHKIATEITVVISGEVEMNGRRYSAGDIITLVPGEGTDFRALTDAVNVVVKLPSARGDKYLKGGERA